MVQLHDDPSSPAKVKKVKLIDFDFADPEYCPLSPKRHAAYVGTMRNSAPETFEGIYTVQSDLYSVGTILYLLMTGGLPHEDSIFDGQGREILDKLKESQIDWSCESWVSQPACADFCRRLLAFFPLSRPSSTADALAHEWFTQ